jgi:hypothetical protein
MTTVFVGARIPPSLYDKISEYLDLVGATKSEILTAALAQYLGAGGYAVELVSRVRTINYCAIF